MSWGAPLTPNGQLEGYRVVYQHTTPVQGMHTHAHTHTLYTKTLIQVKEMLTCVFFFFTACVRAGVSKVVTVDVRGSWQRWLRVRDLIKGATYTFSVQALTVSYGPPIEANLTALPVKGRTQLCRIRYLPGLNSGKPSNCCDV